MGLGCSRQSVHGGASKFEMIYSVPKHDPFAFSVQQPDAAVEAPPEQTDQVQVQVQWSLWSKESLKRTRTDPLGIVLFWIHKLLVIVVLVGTLTSRDQADTESDKTDVALPMMLTAIFVGLVGGLLLLRHVMHSGGDLTQMYYVRLALPGLLLFAVLCNLGGAYGMGFFYLLAVLMTTGWYHNRGKDNAILGRLMFSACQHIFSTLPSLKQVLSIVFVSYFCWVLVCCAAIWGCLHFRSSYWVIGAGMGGAVCTSAVFFNVIACTTCVCVKGFFLFLEADKGTIAKEGHIVPRVRDDLLQSFLQGESSLVERAFSDTIRFKFGSIVIGSVLVHFVSFFRFLVEMLLYVWGEIHLKCCSNCKCCGSCRGVTRGLDELSMRFNKYGVYKLCDDCEIGWYEASKAAWKMLNGSHLHATIQRNTVTHTLAHGCVGVASVAASVCGLWGWMSIGHDHEYSSTITTNYTDLTNTTQVQSHDHSVHSFWFAGGICFVLAMLIVVQTIAVVSATNTAIFMTYLERPKVIAQYYPSLFSTLVKSHLVFLTQDEEFKSAKEYDEAALVVHQYSKILTDIQTRTSLAEEGARVECPFELELCGGRGGTCIHCTLRPPDFIRQWDHRNDGV